MDTDYTAWLGPAAEDMTAEQTERFARVWNDIEGRYPDDPDTTEAVLSATVQYLLGETTLDAAAQRLAAARAAEFKAREVGKQVALLAIEDGADELGASRSLGVARKTLRRAAGKEA